MHAHGAATPVDQRLEVTSGLRSVDDAKRVRLSRHGEVMRFIGGDLEEHPGIGTALVCLSGRVQLPRAKPDAGRFARRVPDSVTDLLKP
jgi:hypothetical protein